MNSDKEYILLEQISHDETPVRQRDLAEIAGLSLGMTNGVLKKFVEKGFVLIEKINARNVKYILTAKGWDELNSRAKKYIKKTVKNVANYRKSIEELVLKAKEDGHNSIALVGESELSFILEWACNKYRIEYKKVDKPIKGFFVVYAEKYEQLINENIV